MKEDYKRLFEKAVSRTNDDELLRAVTSGKKARKKRSARFVLIPAGAAAALALSLFVTAAVVSISRNAPQTSGDPCLDFDYLDYKLPIGIYCLNGDKNSDIWFEVTDNTIQLKGADLKKTFADDPSFLEGVDKNGNTDADSLIKHYMSQYPCSPCEYMILGTDPDAFDAAEAAGALDSMYDIYIGSPSLYVEYCPEDGSVHTMEYFYRTKTLRNYFGDFSWTRQES